MPLYFAYGPTMDPARMAARCPGARALGPARLPRHRLAAGRDGHATIVRDPRRTVHGILWECRLAEMAALDRLERVHTGLTLKISQPVILAGAARRALLYVARSATAGTARPEDVAVMLAAARTWNLPAEYVHEIEHGEPPPRRPGAPLFRAPI